MKLLQSISFFIAAGLIFSCSSKPEIKNIRLTDREVTYQKGLALFNISKYSESAPFFLKVTQSSINQYDEIYNSSLWNLTLIYEKYGEYEKCILALQELRRRHSSTISDFKIDIALMKNYIRLGNKNLAIELRKEVDSQKPMERYPYNEIYFALAETTSFNYDISMVEEIQFMGEIQKYFIFLMESKNASVNARTTDLLIALYEGFFKTFQSESFNPAFKKTVAVELLEQLRRFDYYKINDLNLNMKTVSKFSVYALEKQKVLTDWLHQ